MARRTSIDANKARGGDIVLRRPWQRAVFVAGLAAPVVVALAVVLWAYWR